MFAIVGDRRLPERSMMILGLVHFMFKMSTKDYMISIELYVFLFLCQLTPPVSVYIL